MPRHGTEITREQLDILRNKFDLLQGDRKAYFETYEATKKANEQLLRELREANKDLRKRLSNLQKEGRDAAVAEGTAGLGGTAAGAGAGAPSTALGKLEASLQQKRNAYDLLRSKTKERQKELQTLRDQFRWVSPVFPLVLPSEWKRPCVWAWRVGACFRGCVLMPSCTWRVLTGVRR